MDIITRIVLGLAARPLAARPPAGPLVGGQPSAGRTDRQTARR
jgi:hypothetical protein